jgi:hypothetical protein
LEKEKPALAYTLGKKIVQNKLNLWLLRFFEIGKDFAQMWVKYFEENFKIKRICDIKRTCLDFGNPRKYISVVMNVSKFEKQ